VWNGGVTDSIPRPRAEFVINPQFFMMALYSDFVPTYTEIPVSPGESLMLHSLPVPSDLSQPSQGAGHYNRNHVVLTINAYPSDRAV
jgi:hypothetical protein